MSTILSIDPGSEQSAWLLLRDGLPTDFEKSTNASILGRLWLPASRAAILVIETLHVRGMPTAQAEMETQLWAGRFIQAHGGEFHQIKRMDVKMHHCHSARAKDGNIRQAIIDRFGGKEKAIGKKKTPGVLYGISNDVWSAAAIALMWHDTHPTT